MSPLKASADASDVRSNSNGQEFLTLATVVTHSSGNFRRGNLRCSTPWLLHMFTENIFPGGCGVEPHIALQKRPPDVKQKSTKCNASCFIPVAASDGECYGVRIPGCCICSLKIFSLVAGDSNPTQLSKQRPPEVKENFFSKAMQIDDIQVVDFRLGW